MTTMPGYQPYTPLRPRQRGFGVASLILSLVAVATLLLCGLGMIVALAGLVLGVVALVRGSGRTQAVIGITLSVVVLAAGTAGLAFLLSRAAKCGDTGRYPSDTARRTCIEREFPFARSSTSP